MKEIQDIVAAYDKATAAGLQTALATVVHVEGSSYRRAGARMLVTENGQLTGAISGGCLDGDALRKARLVMQQRQPMLVTYDTTDDDDAKFGVGLGCNGIIHILIEPLFSDVDNNPVELFRQFLAKRENAVLVTLFSLQDKKATQPGTCLMVRNTGIIGDMQQSIVNATIITDAQTALHNHISATKTYGEGLTAFIELLQPIVSLVIFGAGNDTIPLVKMASVLGWHTTVIDGRANYAVPSRFPEAKKVITAKPQQAIDQLDIDARTVLMLMTHNYNYDLAILRSVLPLQLSYVGVLGSKKKLNRMLDEITDEGIDITSEQLISIYGPSGLDIGAETSEEIALSIIAETQGVLQNANGSPLREKPFIHQRNAQQIIEQSVPVTEFIKSCDV